MNYDILMALSELMLSSSWLRYILVDLYLQFLGLIELIVTHVEINYLLIFFFNVLWQCYEEEPSF